MNKSWYAVYTKPQCEKKVAAQLSKKKIENFCPLNRITNNQGNRRKLSYEPLFPSFVFVYITDTDFHTVRQTNDVMNFVFWLGKPAMIRAAEIEQVLDFSSVYQNIRLEKIAVNAGGVIKITREPFVNLNEGMVSGATSIKLTLPSLGFMLTAETEKSLDVYTYGLEDSKLVI